MTQQRNLETIVLLLIVALVAYAYGQASNPQPPQPTPAPAVIVATAQPINGATATPFYIAPTYKPPASPSPLPTIHGYSVGGGLATPGE